MKKKTIWSLALALALVVSAIGASTAALAAASDTAEAGTSGEQKEVSGTGRTGRNFDRNGKDHAAQRGRDASEQRRA